MCAHSTVRASVSGRFESSIMADLHLIHVVARVATFESAWKDGQPLLGDIEWVLAVIKLYFVGWKSVLMRNG